MSYIETISPDAAEGAVLGPLSLLMKGETMPPGCRWHGIPTVQP